MRCLQCLRFAEIRNIEILEWFPHANDPKVKSVATRGAPGMGHRVSSLDAP